MSQSDNLLAYTLVSIGLSVFYAFLMRLGKRHTIGLPMMFLMNLALNHFLGMGIHCLPWYSNESTTVVAKGGELVMVGTLSFVSGAWLSSLGGAIQFSNSLSSESLVRGLRSSGTRYLILGVVFFTVLMPVLSAIPSVAALSVCGVSLVIVGLCLRLYVAITCSERFEMFLWYLSLIALPLITMSVLGFIGYGAVAVLIVVVFSLTACRLNVFILCLGLLALLIGPSVFVTYFRDRSLIRASVWGGEDFKGRFDRISKTFSEFEVFDIQNPAHLRMVDERLNQNILVGMAVINVERGQVELAHGETVLNALIALVPRIIWPGKPPSGGSGNWVSRYTGLVFAEGTSVGIGAVLEFFINYGISGVWIGFFLWGVILGRIDRAAAIALARFDSRRFLQFYLPGLSMLTVLGSFTEISSELAASTVFAFLMNRFYRDPIPTSALETKTV